MSRVDQTIGEVFDSLTGFDEMEITQHFGRTVADLTEDGSMWARSMVFILKRREGVVDDDARTAALNMTLKDVRTYFAEESEDSGKDETSPESSPATSPTSATEPAAVETSI